MTEMRPSKEFVEECLKLADEFLGDAKRFLALGRPRSATDRAYYAMFHAAQAVLASRGFKQVVDKAERFIQKMKEIIGRTS